MRVQTLKIGMSTIPQDARSTYLQAQAKLPTIGTLVDAAMDVIQKENSSLKGVLPLTG